MVQLSQPYVTTGKTIALTIRIFVSSVMSLLFNTLSRFIITFPPRSNRLLISWLQSPSTVILEPKKRKSVTASTFSPSICLEVRCGHTNSRSWQGKPESAHTFVVEEQKAAIQGHSLILRAWSAPFPMC